MSLPSKLYFEKLDLSGEIGRWGTGALWVTLKEKQSQTLTASPPFSGAQLCNRRPGYLKKHIPGSSQATTFSVPKNWSSQLLAVTELEE